MTILRLSALIILWLVQSALAWSAPNPNEPVVALVQGGKAAAFSLPDLNGVMWASQQFAGKVVVVVHADPDHRDDNDPLCEAVKQAVSRGRLSGDLVLGLGIADCQTSWLPKPLLRLLAKFKARKYGATVLFDQDGAVRRDWCLQGAASTVVILDKSGVCRFLATGKLPSERFPAVIDLLASLQREEPAGPGPASGGRPAVPSAD
jgi:predicted transcriptional regulator